LGFGSPGDYLILDTDYENYAALFGCEEENGGPTAAVLTREDHPDSLFVDLALEAFKRLGVDLDLIKPIPHENCLYEPADVEPCGPF